MPTELLDVLATGGSGVALSSVLLYIYLSNVKRLDKVLADHYSERVDITERLIDSVATLSSHVDGLENQIDAISQGIQTGLQEMRTHYTEQRVREASKD